ncbi:hypothetical protein NQ176_g4078 [Zarea fungicola]|uniref:Uncharacterized protein n=1 Tax=Zarea fungicola TaxID=93591 RepID=A0ACC1NG08_9HYPO|nr:hypothetical protein NQ176_g4078 [Lecanicillium fungicola]
MTGLENRNRLALARRLAQVATTRILLLSRSGFAGSSRLLCREFAFAFTAVSLIVSKLVHIYAHLHSLPRSYLLAWGLSLFGQDILLLVLIRVGLNCWPVGLSGHGQRSGAFKRITKLFTSGVIVYSAMISTMPVAFFVVSGTEIHWRNIAFAGDASSRALLLTGLMSLLLVIAGFVAISWVLQDIIYIAAGLAVDALAWPLSYALRRKSGITAPSSNYAAVSQEDAEAAQADFDNAQSIKYGSAEKPKSYSRSFWKMAYFAIVAILILTTILYIIRPNDSSLVYLSWTAPLVPVVDFLITGLVLSHITTEHDSTLYQNLQSTSALSKPVPMTWLPRLQSGKSLTGFADWYESGKLHYDASQDPLRVDNLMNDLLPELRSKLHESPIRHIVLVKMESARKDIWPIKKDEIIWERFRQSFDDKKLPQEVMERMSTLTPTANFITGDYDDGFDHGKSAKPKRGGINFNNAHTTCTFTIKSLVGSLCGITPLLVDFTHEYRSHIYQPCLPQVLDAFNTIDHNKSAEFTSYKWKSYFMQTANLEFDHFSEMVPALGFPQENIVSKETLKRHDAKFGYVDLPDVNYFGMVEEPLEPYIRDAFQSAKNNSERVFLTHVTSTSHHPYGIPAAEKYVPMGHGQSMDDLSHYVNAIGYDDRWLGKMLGYLEEEGVANETLVIFAGDHGLSLPENDIPATYYNPNIGGDHIPLTISHPNMPPITINDPVTAIQLMPTILDLLIETGSLSAPNVEAAKALRDNYEGQSLIRPQKKSTDAPGAGSMPYWQFTVVNPGGPMIAVREPNNPDWRLVVPILENIEWRFTDLKKDPAEHHPVLDFDFQSFLDKVKETHGEAALRWVEDAALATRWAVEENKKRWQWQ